MDRVKFIKGYTEEIDPVYSEQSQFIPIVNGQILYNITTDNIWIDHNDTRERVNGTDIEAIWDKLNTIQTNAEVNQNAFSNVKVGNTTIAADTKTDTLTLTAGTNVTLTPDATNDTVTIAATDTKYTAATTAPGNVASSSSVGTSTNYARQDHTHGISLATGDSNGQVKIAGTNVSVKGLGTAAYTASTAYATAAQGTLAANAIPSSQKGAASGVAELDSNGKVPTSQLPSFVDDVIEGYLYNGKFYKESAHTTVITGETGKIYVDLSTNKTYRWGGSAFTEISSSLALGTTSSTAFRGDYGNAAYTHAVTNKGSAFASGLYKITTNSEGHVTAATAVAKADITGLGIPGSDTDTKNTAGSTDSSSKLFLIGATSQAANPQTYSHDTAYVGTDGKLYSNSKEVVNLSDTQALTNKTYNGYTLAAASAKGVDTSIAAASTSANLPTSAAVAAFVEGKGYKTTDNDTKNTAGSTNSTNTLFLIGATSQAANPQTYSHSSIYSVGTGYLHADGYTFGDAAIDYNSTDKCIEFHIMEVR